jgi:hypothetical protein
MIESRIIKPGYYITASGNDGNKHVLNICKSAAVERPKDSYNVPTLMSEQRVYQQEETVYVYDCVFHESVLTNTKIEQDILDLAVQCVYDLFHVKLIPSTFDRTDDEYYGPYGWNDKTGTARTTKETLASQGEFEKEQIEKAKEILYGKQDSEATIQIHETQEEQVMDLKIQKEPTKKFVIEEIDTRERLENGKIVPDSKVKELPDGKLEITLMLPEIVL